MQLGKKKEQGTKRRSRENFLLDLMGAGRAQVWRGQGKEETPNPGWDREICENPQIWWIWEVERQHRGGSPA